MSSRLYHLCFPKERNANLIHLIVSNYIVDICMTARPKNKGVCDDADAVSALVEEVTMVSCWSTVGTVLLHMARATAPRMSMPGH